MPENQSKIKRIWHRVTGDERSTLKAPMLNTVIMVYIGLTLLCHVLFLIAPFVAFLVQTPLAHIKTYLGLLGAALILADLFTNRVLWRGRYCILLYGICAIAVVSTLLTLSYGIKDNIFDLCWVTIQFALFYSCVYRSNQQKMNRYFKILFGTILSVWLIACCVSIYQYIFQIGYTYVLNRDVNPELVRQGFINNRLFGIFTGLDYAVYMSLMLIICCVHYIAVTKRGWWIKVPLLIAAGIFLIHIILSGSRSVQVAMLLYVFFMTLLTLRNRFKHWKKMKRICACTAASLCVVFIGIACFFGAKEVLAKVPGWVSHVSQSQEQDSGVADQKVTEESENSLESQEQSSGVADQKVTEESENSLESQEQSSGVADQNVSEESETSLESQEQSSGVADQQASEKTENILRRRGLEDISNDRFQIWKDYLGLSKEIGLFGLSLSNYNDYISDKHPDLFIVRYFQEKYGDFQKSDLVYESHNNYLFAFVSTGAFGALLLAVFLILVIINVIRYIRKHPHIPMRFITPLAIVGAGCVEAFFMNSVFLKINAIAFVFWIALGIVMKISCDSRKD